MSLRGKEIDFVIIWVDGNDPEWQKRKAAFTGDNSVDDREERYRDWDLLRFWFRGVENYAPWVNRIWFVCDQEPPKWLNIAHPKLTVVRHEEYLPEAYRPAFSSHPIELNLHRIQGLSEQFVYYNDDMFLTAPVSESFFFRDGLPRDCALLNPISTDKLARNPDDRISPMTLMNAEYLNREFAFYPSLKKNFFKWFHPAYGKGLVKNAVCSLWPKFVGFDEPHLPQAFLKSSFEEAWEQDYDILDQTCRHHLRHVMDINQWFIRERQLAEGKFYVRMMPKDAVFCIQENSPMMHQTIRYRRVPMICLHDIGPMDSETFQKLKTGLQNDFLSVLPRRSSFER